MDTKQFDGLIKGLGSTRLTRATALRGVVVGIATAVTGGALLSGDADAKKKRRANAKKKRQKVRKQDVDDVCGPLNSGKIDTTGDPQTVDLSPTPGYRITRYCVKAGSAQQGDGPEYVDVDAACDATVTISHSSGKDVSHYSYSEEPCTPPPPAQWCSPGYWRQPHHLDSWVATGISPTEKYNDYFDPDLAGDPTLLQVLQSPQTYGGAAFNNVGDLLSAAHPDVNFTGERVPDSCPLN